MIRLSIATSLALALIVTPIAIAAQAQDASAPSPVVKMALPVSGIYQIDPTHTQVRATWNHLGFSRPGATFGHVEGTITLDAVNPAKSSVSVQIPISGVDTGVPALDEHFRSADYFDAVKYPQVTFVSRSVNFTGLGTAFSVEGDLTIRGVTRPIVLQATLNGAGMHPLANAPAVGFSATTQVKRSDFGINAFVPMVSDEIDLVITAEATLAP
ncbi:YceI family protein [Croceicoccus naphthovorans]|nr:YceI family protein [Croceicoccus naphthovorans]MBB3990975.1 polyisoprenoid-binding protein YceI [Croceicoccus naphthovorans]